MMEVEETASTADANVDAGVAPRHGMVMTRDEIYARCVSEWVLVADPEVDEHLDVVRGCVVWHSKDRDEVYRKAVHLRLTHSAFLYTGQIPEDTAVIL